MLLLLSITGLVLIVPLAVWAGTGSLSHAWFALRQYLRAMAWIVVPVLLVVGIMQAPALFL